MTTRSFLGSLSAMLLVASSGLPACAGDDPVKPKDDKLEKAEGVIVKVEKGEGKTQSVKLTINTAAVWRDWVRDQATAKPKGDGKAGENSIATKGEPVSPTTTITVEVVDATRLANRYRSSTDETNEGSPTVEGAEKKDGSPQGQDAKRSPNDKKAPKLAAKDLKVGQFVEVEAKKGKADRLAVLLPVATADAPKTEKK